MKLLFTKNFIHDYRKLPQQIQQSVDKQLGFLLIDPKHPSLQIKKMQDLKSETQSDHKTILLRNS